MKIQGMEGKKKGGGRSHNNNHTQGLVVHTSCRAELIFRDLMSISASEQSKHACIISKNRCTP